MITRHPAHIPGILALLTLLLLLTPVTLAANGGAAPAPDATPVVVDGLTRDAQEYAAIFGVDFQEAMRRLQLQSAIGALGAALESGERATFAGLWVEHRPAYRVIAQFTRDGEQTTQPYIAGGPLAKLVETRTARLTLAQLEAAQQGALRAVHPLGIPVNAGINVRENRAEIYVVERARLDAALGAAGLRLPDGAAVITVPELPRLADAYAGLPITNCTTGFSVAGPQGLGVTTAGHCWNEGSPEYPFIWEWNYGSHDVQWHTAPGQTVRSWAPTGPGTVQNITATKGREYTFIGEVVCKYGRNTGYGCGGIVDRFVQGLGPPYDTNYSYIRVGNWGYDLSEGGDSGGPWFNGSTAYGIMHGQWGWDGIFMPINYILDTGLTVLLNCPDGC